MLRELNLIRRNCIAPGCKQTFRVLEGSAQNHCCELHNPNRTGWRNETGEKRTPQQTEQMISICRDGKSAGLSKFQIAEKLIDAGFKTPRGKKITAAYTGVFMYWVGLAKKKPETKRYWSDP